MTKTLLVGYAPVADSPGDRLGLAFVATPSGRNLARHLGLANSGELLERFDHMVNLNREVDAPYDSTTARRRAAALEAELIVPGRYTHVVLFSGPVAEAFEQDYHPLFEWRVRTFRRPRRPLPAETHVAYVGVCPHPSGLVRTWNDPQTAVACRSFLEPVMHQVRSGEVAPA